MRPRLSRDVCIATIDEFSTSTRLLCHTKYGKTI